MPGLSVLPAAASEAVKGRLRLRRRTLFEVRPVFGVLRAASRWIRYSGRRFSYRPALEAARRRRFGSDNNNNSSTYALHRRRLRARHGHIAWHHDALVARCYSCGSPFYSFIVFLFI